MKKQVVIQGNNLDLLPLLPEASIDAIVTDPPYGLAFMGKSWDKTLPDPRTWTEALRVLKPGGHALIFGAPRLYHRLAVAVEDAGFEVRDVLMWMFGSGFPKSLDVSKAIDGHLGVERTEVVGQHACPGSLGTTAYGKMERKPVDLLAPATSEAAAWAGWGTALKPAYEPILLVRKPLIGTVAANVLTYGTGGINVDACRVGDEVLPPAVSGTAGGFASYSGGSGAVTPERVGRWPANVIMDEGPEEWRRYFYCPKASRSEREAGLEAFPARVVDESREDGSAGRENPRAGAGRKGGGRRNHHPTVKPLDLMAWLVRLITPPGGIVLDPFTGSGSTLVACAREDVRGIGFELDPEYVAIANARIAHEREKR